jgi:thiol-disulfide isomerase/thioredoxin
MVGEVGVPIGSSLEPVEVADLEGNPVDLGEYIGNGPVLFEVWATWCENCEALLPQMERVHAEYRDRMDFVAIAAGVGQTPRSIKRHLRRHAPEYRYLYDTRGAAVRLFAAPTTSFIIALDAAGLVTYTGVGRDQDIEAAVLSALEPVN